MNTFSAHIFNNLGNVKFNPEDYSKFKFGSTKIAKKFGYELAEKFFNEHSDILMSNRCVVIPSPYNHVKNAATLLAESFVNRINELLVEVNGEHVEFSMIHRKITYTNDYGFLSKEKRKSLINNDSFYFNKDFIKDKVLIFIDDVFITGSHEEKLIDVLDKENLQNKTIFLYYGKYNGCSPEIEAELNFSGIKDYIDYIKIVSSEDNQVIVRTIKYLLGSDYCKKILKHLSKKKLEDIYFGSLGEGYYKIPKFQENFKLIKTQINND